MNITEIELVGPQSFPIEKIEQYFSISTPQGKLDDFVVSYLEHDNQRVLILSDLDKKIAAFAAFEMWNNGRVWQAKNAETFRPYKGRALVAKIYKYVKDTMHKSIQSDSTQSYGGIVLWCKSLPALGLKPMIFDTKTERIIDPDTSDIDVYSVCKDNDPTQWRYTWILERFDHYPSQNLLLEDSLLLPITGMWKR